MIKVANKLNRKYNSIFVSPVTYGMKIGIINVTWKLEGFLRKEIISYHISYILISYINPQL